MSGFRLPAFALFLDNSSKRKEKSGHHTHWGYPEMRLHPRLGQGYTRLGLGLPTAVLGIYISYLLFPLFYSIGRQKRTALVTHNSTFGLAVICRKSPVRRLPRLTAVIPQGFHPPGFLFLRGTTYRCLDPTSQFQECPQIVPPRLTPGVVLPLSIQIPDTVAVIPFGPGLWC